MSKLRVAVLRGGPSPEYDVSLKTGGGVIGALPPERYEPIDVVISRSGEWLMRGRSRDPHEILHGVDVVFNALHGAYGEDGQVQRLLERVSVPFTGSRSYPSAIAMNKAITKDSVRDTGVLLARHIVVGRDALANLTSMAHSVTALFGPRYIVKPIAGGSSVATSRANNEAELVIALKIALDAAEQAIIEEYIEGREATCGIIEQYRGQELYALPPIEILVAKDSAFFDYNAKYSGESDEICPGRFSLEEKRAIEKAAMRVHERLELSHYSRSDFIVTSQGIYFLEVNTLPGLTAESLLPKAIVAVGSSYSELIVHLIERALHTPRRSA